MVKGKGAMNLPHDHERNVKHATCFFPCSIAFCLCQVSPYSDNNENFNSRIDFFLHGFGFGFSLISVTRTLPFILCYRIGHP